MRITALQGVIAATLPTTSCFGSVEAASAFFAAGSIAYSPVCRASTLE